MVIRVIYILDEYDLLTKWSFCITPLPRGFFSPKNKKESQDFRVSRKYQARQVKHFEYIFFGLLESFSLVAYRKFRTVGKKSCIPTQYEQLDILRSVL
jgi:hypothetical protein